jgi:lipoprotein-anchoring transpeptidase ErfK/SrfK
MESEGKIKDNPDPEKDNSQSNKNLVSSDPETISNQGETVQEKPVPEPSDDHSELENLLLHFWQKIYSNVILRLILRKILLTILIITLLIFIFSWFIYIIPYLQETGKGNKHQTINKTELKNDPAYKKQMSQLAKDEQKLFRKFVAYTPGQSYLVINTTDNRFSLYRNKKLVREGFCSTGSYTRLTNAEGSRHWIFKTPKGRFWIQEKITSPLWVRPDWSFVEEGLPIPPKNDESRYEYGVLGDYAMSLGDGYLIHGTIYKRFLGMPVTHGCVRLNDDDLEAIYNTLNIGSKVYIF